MKRIRLTQGQFAIVDDRDYESVRWFKWYALWKPSTQSFIAMRKIVGDKKRRNIRLHTQLMVPPAGLEVDHKNHDTLDNRRSNLKVCTHKENMQNRMRHPVKIIRTSVQR